jgi:hypothetical protein
MVKCDLLIKLSTIHQILFNFEEMKIFNTLFPFKYRFMNTNKRHLILLIKINCGRVANPEFPNFVEYVTKY